MSENVSSDRDETRSKGGLLKVAHMNRKLKTAGAIVAGVIVLCCVSCWLFCNSPKNGKTRTISHKSGETRTIVLPGGATMEMIYVEPGSFMMGSPTTEEDWRDDETQHRVTLTKGFWLGKYEVTQKQWRSVMGDNPSWFTGDDRPVEKVSWEDCQKFIAKVDSEARRQLGGGARLPTEAEWEYACRAGTTGAYAGRSLDAMGWYGDNSGYETHTVGQKQANALGFYDMHGNVWEWCSDWYGSDYYKNSPSVDPQGPASGDYRVFRGGSWYDGARDCRPANRGWFEPGIRDSSLGFRVALAPSH